MLLKRHLWLISSFMNAYGYLIEGKRGEKREQKDVLNDTQRSMQMKILYVFFWKNLISLRT